MQRSENGEQRRRHRGHYDSVAAPLHEPAIHRPQFMPARDSRNRRVHGVYVRNGGFYAQLWVDLGNGKKAARRMPLFDAENLPIRALAVAKEALEIKRHDRRESRLRTLGRKPSLANYQTTYFEKARVQRKRPGTLQIERQSLARWCDYIGHVRIDQISPALIIGFIEKRLKGGTFGGRQLEPVSERTANLDLLMLRNLLNSAVADGLLREFAESENA